MRESLGELVATLRKFINASILWPVILSMPLLLAEGRSQSIGAERSPAPRQQATSTQKLPAQPSTAEPLPDPPGSKQDALKPQQPSALGVTKPTDAPQAEPAKPLESTSLNPNPQPAPANQSEPKSTLLTPVAPPLPEGSVVEQAPPTREDLTGPEFPPLLPEDIAPEMADTRIRPIRSWPVLVSAGVVMLALTVVAAIAVLKTDRPQR
jgi:hypothetical protein